MNIRVENRRKPSNRPSENSVLSSQVVFAKKERKKLGKKGTDASGASPERRRVGPFSCVLSVKTLDFIGGLGPERLPFLLVPTIPSRDPRTPVRLFSSRSHGPPRGNAYPRRRRRRNTLPRRTMGARAIKYPAITGADGGLVGRLLNLYTFRNIRIRGIPFNHQ